jgi:glutamate dehydrogenase/leucine dehydrogenase
MSETCFTFEEYCDDLGPIKIVHLYEPSCGLRGIVVIDNVACGTSIGGVRMAPDVSTREVFRLARAMTLKNAAAGLPHGGGKAGIVADPRTPDKARLIRAFARAIRDLVDYIPGPDMGTDEICMGWMHDEIKRALGLPRVLGGIPLDEIGATGFGLAECAEVAAPVCNLVIKGATVAIEGFGNVGKHVARFLEEKGAKLVAASDRKGTIYDPAGISVAALIEAKVASGSVVGYSKGKKLDQSEIFGLPCDILIPAARPDCIHKDNVETIQAKLILQGANIPATPEAETRLYQRGILNIPDLIANAGGVTCASVEYHGGNEAQAFQEISQKIRRNTQEVLSRSRKEGIEPRKAAVDLARERVRHAMTFRACG